MKKLLLNIWQLIKKFPITCYGIFSLTSHLIFSYDYYIFALIFGAPFIWMITSIEELLFPDFFLRLASAKSSALDLIIHFFVGILVGLLLDILFSKIFSKLKQKLSTRH